MLLLLLVPVVALLALWSWPGEPEAVPPPPSPRAPAEGDSPVLPETAWSGRSPAEPPAPRPADPSRPAATVVLEGRCVLPAAWVHHGDLLLAVLPWRDVRDSTAEGHQLRIAPDNGTFRLELEPGPWALRASGDGIVSPTTRVTLDLRQPHRELTLHLVPAGRIVGRLESADGAPLAGLGVGLLDAQDAVVAHGTVDASGAFELAPVPPGEHTLFAGSPRRPILTDVVGATGGLVELRPLRAPRLLAVKVRVVDAAGQPVAGARVHGEGSKSGALSGVTDSTGRLVASALPIEHYRVFASHPMFGRGNTFFDLSTAGPEEVVVSLAVRR